MAVTVETIEACATIPELADTWAHYVTNDAGNTPEYMAQVLVTAKNCRKAELAVAGVGLKELMGVVRNGYPIPTTEKAFAKDERQAIVEFDGGWDPGPSPPVEVKMDSSIPGVAVEDLQAVHTVKSVFEGQVVPLEEVDAFETKPISARDFPVRNVVTVVVKRKCQKHKTALQNLNLFEREVLT